MAQSTTATDLNIKDSFHTIVKTPCGHIKIIGTSSYIERTELLSGEHKEFIDKNWKLGLLAKNQIKQYFEGSRKKFDLPFHFNGTDFQKNVWHELSKLNWGEVITYGNLAKRIGKEKAYQAVGSAVGKNPIPFFIPCHRIVAGNGIGGFSAPMSWKTGLLGHEKYLKSMP